ncbi:uncharacterized protein LOC135375283 [Ornithodoros turicata]|uniref:uncharacterized protein LOC135375283 n=1 Tax=Ornithodoros turicata TaxID=34597 RepID=UPI003139E9EE
MNQQLNGAVRKQHISGDTRITEGLLNAPFPSQNRRDVAFEKEVLKVLHMLKVTQQAQSEQLSAILHSLSSAAEEAESQRALPMPFRRLSDFLQFEEDLADSDTKRSQLRKFIRSVGGGNPRELTFRFLSRLLGYSVGKEYSLFGNKGKRKFSNLTTWTIMLNYMTETKGATVKEVEQATMSWLRHAPEACHREEQKAAMEQD